MIKKICICSTMEAGRLDDECQGSENRLETINWVKNSDESHETGSLRDEEINAKVKCQCGKYMETHLKGRYHKIMIAVCSCNDPKPVIMECDQMESIMDNKKEVPVFTVIGCCLICRNGNPHGGRIYCLGSGPGLSMYKGEYDYCDNFKLRDGIAYRTTDENDTGDN